MRFREKEMTIIGLFRRYHRWNPVYPTYGAFWGVGIGAGCGVGWGPGFGPDAVGFVGAGCGVGLSIGFTFVGLGIGFPTNGLACLPYDALTCVSSEAFHLAKIAAPVISHQANETQRNMLKSFGNLHLMDFSRSIEDNARKTWHSIEISISEWEQKLRTREPQSIKLVEYPSNSSIQK